MSDYRLRIIGEHLRAAQAALLFAMEADTPEDLRIHKDCMNFHAQEIVNLTTATSPGSLMVDLGPGPGSP